MIHKRKKSITPQSRKRTLIVFITIISVIIVITSIIVITKNTGIKGRTITEAYPLTKKQMKNKKLIETREDNYSEHFLSYMTADDNIAYFMYAAPIEYSSNSIIPLKKSNNNYIDGYAYISEGSYFIKLFPAVWDKEHPIIIKNNINVLKIFPEKSVSSKAKFTKKANAFDQEKGVICYRNAINHNLDFNCYATSFGINTEIVVNKKSKLKSYSVNVSVENSTYENNSTDYILFTNSYGNKDPKAIITNILAVDKNKSWCDTNSIYIQDSEYGTGFYSVNFELDSDFTKNVDVELPITLNQSFNLYKSKQPDLPVYSETGSELGFYLSPYMLLGNNNSKGNGLGFIRFEILEKFKFDSEKIISAKYYLYNLFDLPAPVKISAYAITNDWCSINTKWFNKPSYEPNAVSSIYIKEKGEYCLDITSLFKLMMSETNNKEEQFSVRNSFFVKSENENSRIILPTGDNGMFSPVLEVVTKG